MWPEEQSGKIYFDTHVSYLTYDVNCDVILLYFNDFTNLIWILQNVHHVWSCLTWSEERYSKHFLDIISCFQPIASFVTSICYIHRLLEQNLICRKCLSLFKLFKKIRGTIWLNTSLIPCLIFFLWRHFWRHFAIFPLFWNFIAFWSIFNWFLQKLFHGWCYLKWLEAHFCNLFFLYRLSSLPYEILCDVVFLHFTYSRTLSPFWATLVPF